MEKTSPEVRRLASEHASAYVALRREMLLDSPWAFGSSPEDDRRTDAAAVAAMFQEADKTFVGLFEAGRLVSTAGLLRHAKIKRKHTSEIIGVYTSPDARSRGYGRACVAALIEIARSTPGVEVVGLSVTDRAVRAHAMYVTMGFIPWGVEPDAVRAGGGRHALIHMRLELFPQS
jgi:RimJ/RimL family protein N-acetyltransferase